MVAKYEKYFNSVSIDKTTQVYLIINHISKNHMFCGR